MSVDIGPIGVIAEKEFWDRIRNRWVLAVAAVFAIFALAIAYLGTAQQGAIGFRGIDVTIASLVSLVILSGSADCAPPGVTTRSLESATRARLTCCCRCRSRGSNFCSESFAAATGARFFHGGGLWTRRVMLSYHVGLGALYKYAVFLVSALLLGWVFLSLAVMISVTAGTGFVPAVSPLRCGFFTCWSTTCFSWVGGREWRKVRVDGPSRAADAQSGRRVSCSERFRIRRSEANVRACDGPARHHDKPVAHADRDAGWT